MPRWALLGALVAAALVTGFLLAVLAPRDSGPDRAPTPVLDATTTIPTAP